MIKLSDLDKEIDAIDEIIKNGPPSGISCGWPNLDPFFTLTKGSLNILSGYPSSGKSEFVDNIACRVARDLKWNIYSYSPETYPVHRYMISLMEKMVGKPTRDRNGVKAMTDKERYKAEYHIKKRFSIVSATDDPYSFEDILKDIDKRCLNGQKIDMVVLDPWNEMESSRPANITETDYIGRSLMMARRVARRHLINFWIVPHPAKPTKNKDGNYDMPTLYSLAGSAHWRNKADNGIIVHRPSLQDTRVEIHIMKIKNRFYGNHGVVHFEFDTVNGRFNPATEPGWNTSQQ